MIKSAAIRVKDKIYTGDPNIIIFFESEMKMAG